MTYAPVNGLQPKAGESSLSTLRLLAMTTPADAQLAVLPGTTHIGVTRRPGELLALITPFLNAC